MTKLLYFRVALEVDAFGGSPEPSQKDLRAVASAMKDVLEHWRQEEGLFPAESDCYTESIHSVSPE